MDLSPNETVQCLRDLQIPGEMRARCIKLAETQQYEALYPLLRGARAQFLKDMHIAQERLDRLDRLIYDIKRKSEEL